MRHALLGNRLFLAGLLVAGVSCAITDTNAPAEEIPPRMNLAEWSTIGIVTFESGIDAQLAGETTREFIEMLQLAQPEVRIVELGASDTVLAAVGHHSLDVEAARALGERYGVEAVFTGELELREAKPRFEFGDSLPNVRARLEVAGELAARLMETESGALLWSRSSSGHANVADVGVAEGRPTFGAQGRAEAETGLVEHLVSELRYDFYPGHR